MITITNKSEDCYFLPDDGDIAKKRFLDTLAMPGDIFISCFGFTLQEAFDTIAANDAKGYNQSLLLDYTQASGKYAKPKIKELLSKTKNCTVILTSAGNKSKKTTSYWHWKGLVKVGLDKRKAPICVDGSTNISISAFYQGNSMRFFNNKLWAETFISQHNANKEWALKSLSHYQPAILADGVDTIDLFFDNLEENDFELDLLI
jgi:hypothetical protein